jgi:hypothetical protein
MYRNAQLEDAFGRQLDQRQRKMKDICVSLCHLSRNKEKDCRVGQFMLSVF